jgi:hypothetical protein
MLPGTEKPLRSQHKSSLATPRADEFSLEVQRRLRREFAAPRLCSPHRRRG